MPPSPASPLASLLAPSSTSSRHAQSPAELILVQARLNTHLPLVSTLLRTSLRSKHHVLLVTFDVPTGYFTQAVEEQEGKRLRALDYSARVPGYDLDGEGEWVDPYEEILAAAKSLPPGPITLLLSGIDTYSSDTSPSRAYTLLKSLSPLASSPGSRLLIPLPPTSPLTPLLIPPTALSPALTHLLLHPPALLAHLAGQFLTLPPPYGEQRRFWALFTGAAERGEGVVEREVGLGEGLVEVRVRRRGRVERTLQGWRAGVDGAVEACAWEDVAGMREAIDSLRRTNQTETQTPAPDPTLNLPFNLSLTPAQEQARAAVPLPYAHSGEREDPQAQAQLRAGEILYEPDSGDDVDDDDPDEDLDI